MKKLIGACAAAALITGGAAFAGGDNYDKNKNQQTQTEQPSQDALGGSGQAGEGESVELGHEGAAHQDEGLGGSGQAGMHQDAQLEQQDQGLGGSGQAGMQQQEQASVQGEVVRKQGDILFLKLEEGAIVPVKVSRQTSFDLKKQDAMQGGQQMDGQQQMAQGQKEHKQLRGQQALQKLGLGSKVTAQVTTRQGQNLAQQIQVSEAAKVQELEGKIASKSGNWINIQHEGALIPLKVNRETRLQAQEGQVSLQQLKQNDEIRASFEVEGTENVAKSIEVTQQQQGQQQQRGMQDTQRQQQQKPQDTNPQQY